MAISNLNNFQGLSVFDNNYTEDAVKELLNGIVVDQLTLADKINTIRDRYGLTDINRCIFYGRVSTKNKEQSSSIINQHNLASEFENEFMSRGFIVVEEVFERESATTAKKRKKFMNLVNRAKQSDRNFDFIVVKQVDRMFRNVKDTVFLMDELRKYDVGLLFFWDNLNSLDVDDRNEIIAKANEAEAYSNKLSKNVRRGQSRNLKTGVGRVPAYCFGYDKPNVNNSAIMNINDTEAVLVKELFNRYVYNRDSLGEITLDWRNRGIKTKLNKEIATIALRRMLQNKIYIGVIQNKRQTRETIRDEYVQVPEEDWLVFIRPDLRIISDELFELAQQRLKEEEFGKEHMLAVPKNRIFKSMIRCSVCGKNFKQIKNGYNSEGEHNLYYVCATHKQKTRNAELLDCSNKSCFRKDEMLTVLGLYFTEMLSHREDIENLVRNSVANILEKISVENNKEDYSVEIDLVNEKYKRELRLYRDGIIESTTELKKLKNKLDELKAKQATLEASTMINYDIDTVMKNIFTSVEELVKNGLNEETLDAVKFNEIFENMIATTDNRLIINIKGSRFISNNFISTFVTPTELDVEKVHNSLYSNEQLNVLESIRKHICFISIEQCFDMDRLNKEVNAIRNKDTTNRRRYRYSTRYKYLGLEMIDSVNIIL